MRKLSIVIMAVLAISITGCKKEKLITLSETSTMLHHGETYQISAQCENPINDLSANEYHAKVSSSGVITAQYVGSTTISLQSEEDAKTFIVTVAPKSNLYVEPTISFGETKSSVISKLGTPDATTDGGIAYRDYSTAVEMLLVLLDDYDKVKAYGVVVKSSYTSELSDFLDERYDYVGYSNEIFVYRNALTNTETTMIVGLKLYNVNYWMVVYAPSDNKSVFEKDSIDALLKILG